MRLTVECVDLPENGHQPEFSMIEGKMFGRERAHIDNHQYKNCRFECTTFVYSGGPFGFLDCELDGDPYLCMTGSARRTMKLHKQFAEHMKTRPQPLC
jgi:hypothetical protein